MDHPTKIRDDFADALDELRIAATGISEGILERHDVARVNKMTAEVRGRIDDIDARKPEPVTDKQVEAWWRDMNRNLAAIVKARGGKVPSWIEKGTK